MKFHDLFKGRQDVYGKFVLGSEVRGKIQGKAWTERKELTKELYSEHLDGKQGLGVVPIMKSNDCWWGAIDIDDYNIDLKNLEKRIESLPLVLCRTKSGGAHLYLFCKKPISAVILRAKLLEFAAVVGYPSSEIFPKQDELERESDVGNWINLPYFDHKRTTRYAIRNSKALDLNQFLRYAKEKAITEENLEKIKVELSEELVDGPPCLQHLVTIGIQAGQKDTGLFNLGVYCKLKFGDSWEQELESMNQKFVKPPALASTLMKVMKPHRRKEYFYMCDKQPLMAYCNKDICIARKFGIGNDDTPSIAMGCLTKIETDPPIWYLDIDGRNIEFDTGDLMDQSKFRRICFEEIHKIPRRIKDAAWDKLMQEKLDNLEVIEAPEDAGPEGQFYFLLKEFCTKRAFAMSRGELLHKKPWTDDGRTYFQSPALIQFLHEQKFFAFKPSKIYSCIRKIGGEPANMKIHGLSVRLWSIPEFEKQTEDFEIPEIEDGSF